MKKKQLLIATVVVVVIVGAGVGYWVYRNLALEPVVTVEQSPEISQPVQLEKGALLNGEFQDADALHSGSGLVQVSTAAEGKPVLVFDEGFSVTSGPDLYVYLSPNSNADPLGEFVSLGKLKSDNGPQSYNLPENYKDFKSVTIWCRAFGVKFSYANLE
jgi:hypothetical protein